MQVNRAERDRPVPFKTNRKRIFAVHRAVEPVPFIDRVQCYRVVTDGQRDFCALICANFHAEFSFPLCERRG